MPRCPSCRSDYPERVAYCPEDGSLLLPALLDKRLLGRHYRSSTLAAGPARRGWVEPDLLPFPWPVQGSTAG